MEIITLYNLSHQSSIARFAEVHQKIMVKYFLKSNQILNFILVS